MKEVPDDHWNQWDLLAHLHKVSDLERITKKIIKFIVGTLRNELLNPYENQHGSFHLSRSCSCMAFKRFYIFEEKTCVRNVLQALLYS